MILLLLFLDEYLVHSWSKSLDCKWMIEIVLIYSLLFYFNLSWISDKIHNLLTSFIWFLLNTLVSVLEIYIRNWIDRSFMICWSWFRIIYYWLLWGSNFLFNIRNLNRSCYLLNSFKLCCFRRCWVPIRCCSSLPKIVSSSWIVLRYYFFCKFWRCNSCCNRLLLMIICSYCVIMMNILLKFSKR
jgi:hypothetical protein